MLITAENGKQSEMSWPKKNPQYSQYSICDPQVCFYSWTRTPDKIILEDSSTKQAARSGHREQSETSELLKSGTLDFAAVQWYSGTVAMVAQQSKNSQCQ